MNDQTPRKLLLLFFLLILIYLGIAFTAPIFTKFGYPKVGNSIYVVYERFCHQRVERSLFLFGQKSFYSISQLKNEKIIPQKSNTNAYPEYFGHGYIGNEKVGYKVAVCIRDIALYGTVGLLGLLLSFVNPVKKKFSIWIIFVLLSPIFFDVMFQAIVEVFRIQSIPAWYLDNIPKRIISGVLAGVGIILSMNHLFIDSNEKSIRKVNIS